MCVFALKFLDQLENCNKLGLRLTKPSDQTLHISLTKINLNSKKSLPRELIFQFLISSNKFDSFLWRLRVARGGSPFWSVNRPFVCILRSLFVFTLGGFDAHATFECVWRKLAQLNVTSMWNDLSKEFFGWLREPPQWPVEPENSKDKSLNPGTKNNGKLSKSL